MEHPARTYRSTHTQYIYTHTRARARTLVRTLRLNVFSRRREKISLFSTLVVWKIVLAVWQGSKKRSEPREGTVPTYLFLIVSHGKCQTSFALSRSVLRTRVTPCSQERRANNNKKATWWEKLCSKISRKTHTKQERKRERGEKRERIREKEFHICQGSILWQKLESWSRTTENERKTWKQKNNGGVVGREVEKILANS